MSAEFKIQLRDVILFARHGVMPEEHTLGNQYCINVSLSIDASSFDEQADDLSSTVSYADVFEILRRVMSEPKALLESVAVTFAKEVKKVWPQIKSGEIEIIKITPPISDMIGKAGVCYKF